MRRESILCGLVLLVPLAARDDLGEVLRDALKLKPPSDLDARADKQAAEYDGAALRASEAAREAERRKRVAAYRALLVEGPTLLITPTDRRRVATNNNTAVPLEGVGTVYRIAGVSDDWGVLEVNDGAALMIYSPGGRVSKSTSRPPQTLWPVRSKAKAGRSSSTPAGRSHPARARALTCSRRANRERHAAAG